MHRFPFPLLGTILVALLVLFAVFGFIAFVRLLFARRRPRQSHPQWYSERAGRPAWVWLVPIVPLVVAGVLLIALVRGAQGTRRFVSAPVARMVPMPRGIHFKGHHRRARTTLHATDSDGADFDEDRTVVDNRPVESATTDDPLIFEPSAPELPIAAPQAQRAKGDDVADNGAKLLEAADAKAAVKENKPASPKNAPAAAPAGAAPVASEDAKLPDWVNQKSHEENDRRLVVVTGPFEATAREAKDAAIASAIKRIEEDFAEAYPQSRGGWSPPMSLVRSQVIRHIHVQPVDRTTSTSGTHFRVYRGYCQVELSPTERQALFPYWREVVVESRLWELGELGAFLTLTVATLAAYFRLDERTAGRYRHRLKFAAVAVIAACGGAAALFR